MGGRGSVFLNILSQIKIEVWDYWIATIQVLLKEKLYNLIFSSGNMRVVKSDQFISIEQEWGREASIQILNIDNNTPKISLVIFNQYSLIA